MAELLQSKKFIVSLTASILALVGLYLGLPVDQVLTIVAPLATYTIGQGIADSGKEAAKLINGK